MDVTEVRFTSRNVHIRSDQICNNSPNSCLLTSKQLLKALDITDKLSFEKLHVTGISKMLCFEIQWFFLQLS